MSQRQFDVGPLVGICIHGRVCYPGACPECEELALLHVQKAALRVTKVDRDTRTIEVTADDA